MTLSIEKIPEPTFRDNEQYVHDLENGLADPRMHAESHLSCLKESDENVDDLMQLKELIDELRADVDRLNSIIG